MTESGSIQTSNQSCIVESILPSNEVHLISGPSGAGKTTLALQLAIDISEGRDVFGHPSCPVPFVYVACERSKRSLTRDLRRIGADPENFPCASLIHPLREERHPSVEYAIDAGRKERPSARLIFLDGIASLCPGKITDYRDVSRFLISISHICHDQLLTIIGIACSAKERAGEGYASPRDRIAGSAAWSAVTETKILVEPYRPSKPQDGMRTVTLMPRGVAAETFVYSFCDGRLEKTDHVGEVLCHPELDNWLQSLAPGTQVSSQDIQAAGGDLSRSTIYRWIDDQLSLGTLLKSGRAAYVVPPVVPVQ